MSRGSVLSDKRETEGSLTAEIIEHDVGALDTQILQHVDHGRIHHRRSAQVVLAILWRGMILQVVVVQHLMDEAGIASVVLFLRVGQRHMPFEIVILGGQLVEVVNIEHLPLRTGAVPE